MNEWSNAKLRRRQSSLSSPLASPWIFGFPSGAASQAPYLWVIIGDIYRRIGAFTVWENGSI